MAPSTRPRHHVVIKLAFCGAAATASALAATSHKLIGYRWWDGRTNLVSKSNGSVEPLLLGVHGRHGSKIVLERRCVTFGSTWLVTAATDGSAVGFWRVDLLLRCLFVDISVGGT
ncbi:hypothetical protein F441_08641 [Phytophthora nicotianae CJ01A1]|uniref:Uncharacterized protein n=5 Tax=Phytophthora nicotianae TaxID=4792 RepID=W2Q6X9_PHYN3|nr:hypothetical protein PPTG_22901 [Phytophthora nicotianae INRA-310]ETI47061.1 hypothetical protein F443_08664 [Phytophthora nicotianae P1569]ETK86989.1 hypothetical protein L915_08498 [Phytophthora nicotianae]ETP16852.1 hypothetical protein F441_08641 [Phytophthora nicotianae CJ01A1]ETP44909.1 hypothetical protein F442_08596 [Phytophthora nicotianae P10297]ETL40403.1 hypothetical protein L916_08427 [Phytophthora nicotianae]